MVNECVYSIALPSSGAHEGEFMSEHIDPMIVRIARAIALSQGSTEWRNFLNTARASLEAMRDPSVEMLEAATPGLPDWGELPEEWRAMIDHVLGEGPDVNDNRANPQIIKVAG
jgi:hypothetical protein